MKLSQAILKGCEMIPRQGFRGLFGWARVTRDGQDCLEREACALGSAIVAVQGYEYMQDVFLNGTGTLITWEDIGNKLGCADKELLREVVRWNDLDKLSREEIAQRLDDRGF